MTTRPDMSTDTVVIGAGIVGIAVAYYLVRRQGVSGVVLIDPCDPMSLTSAQSGENYRNWWPHPILTAYTDHSMDLMEEIARETDNRINMTRRGYALVTRRSNPNELFEDLARGYADSPGQTIRFHEEAGSTSYVPPTSRDWTTSPQGVDVLRDPALIRSTFPSFSHDVGTVIHVRRAGSISSQQLGQFMLEHIRAAGGRVLRGKLVAIEGVEPFGLRVDTGDGLVRVNAEKIVNAAGPFLNDVAAMLGEVLPMTNVYQQKIAFEDRERAIPRNMPFAIDLDRQSIAWTDEECEILGADPDTAKFLAEMPGAIHCRPDGSESGTWVKMGWAYNSCPTDPHASDPIDAHFPDIVLRGASRLNPKLAAYIGRLPRGAHHYGGYYPMTPENWPLVGPMKTKGAFVAGALSGFGTMAACSTGAICAAWMTESKRPGYARALSAARYDDDRLMAEVTGATSRGVL